MAPHVLTLESGPDGTTGIPPDDRKPPLTRSAPPPPAAPPRVRLNRKHILPERQRPRTQHARPRHLRNRPPQAASRFIGHCLPSQSSPAPDLDPGPVRAEYDPAASAGQVRKLAITFTPPTAQAAPATPPSPNAPPHPAPRSPRSGRSLHGSSPCPWSAPPAPAQRYPAPAYKIATAPVASKAETDVAAPSFPSGFFLAVANPKAYAAIGAVFSSNRLIEANLPWDAVAKVAALTPVILIVNTAWLVFGAVLSSFLRDPTTGRIANIVFAVMLVLSVSLVALG